MKQHLLKHINMIICTIIALGFACIEFANYSMYEKRLKADIENISKLTSSNIYAEINRELNKPINISLTMANDSFLKDWLHSETPGDAIKEHKINEYLKTLQQKFGYNSVFLVSSRTNTYYHYEKVHKKISPSDPHDVWYYRFLNEDKPYDLVIDTDEAARNILTIFINCRILDSDGSVMGVVGVGITMTQLQCILHRYESNFNLQAFLVDTAGLLQAASNLQLINTSVFELIEDASPESILKPNGTMEGYWLNSFHKDNYCIVRYLPGLEWYLLIKKDTLPIRNLLLSQIVTDAVGCIIIIALVLICVSLLVSGYKKTMISIATTDDLTGLRNRRAFGKVLVHELGTGNTKEEQVVFVFDVDHFKTINDTYGHLFGDKVILSMSQLARNHLNEHGEVFRWGGDEFFGILHTGLEEALPLLQGLLERVREDALLKAHGITLSLGVTQMTPHDDFDTLFARADKALYTAKEQGRNRIVII